MSDLPNLPVTDQALGLSFYVCDRLWASVSLSPDFIVAILIVGALLIGWRLLRNQVFTRSLEIDEAEIGIGNQTLRLRPNEVDRQIAYQIWIELSTRKIGLPIDREHDVVSEVYDSWYSFFSVTRELIKEVPVSKMDRKDTEQIIRLAIEVLNTGIRPHLTQWQARFRRWYDTQLKLEENTDDPPQDIQQRFPQFNELSEDMQRVNQLLIRYRSQMYKLVTGKESDPMNLARSPTDTLA